MKLQILYSGKVIGMECLYCRCCRLYSFLFFKKFSTFLVWDPIYYTSLQHVWVPRLVVILSVLSVNGFFSEKEQNFRMVRK